MKNYTIKNDACSLSVDTYGAELSSFKVGDKEYIWQRDPEVWPGSAPVLFPIVGMLKGEGETTLIDGKPYHMEIHGFAKDTDFTLENITDDSVTLSIESNEETLKMYPYNFKFSVEYKLEDNAFVQTYIIENRNDCDMPFVAGTHPGFNMPIFEGEFSDHKLVFEKNENAPVYRIDNNGIIDDYNTETIFDNNNEIALDYSLFDKGALVFEKLNSKWVKLLDKKGRGVRVDFADFDYFGVWQKPLVKPGYLCLEPWTGMNDVYSGDGIYKNKRGMRFIAPHKKVTLAIKVTAI